MVQTVDAVFEDDLERRVQWSKVLEKWDTEDTHHRDKLKILLFVNPTGFLDVKDRVDDEKNEGYDKHVCVLFQKALPAPADKEPEKQDQKFIVLLGEVLMSIHQKNAWHEKHSEIFKRFLMGKGIAQCTQDKVEMVQAGVAFFKGHDQHFFLHVDSVITVSSLWRGRRTSKDAGSENNNPPTMTP